MVKRIVTLLFIVLFIFGALSFFYKTNKTIDKRKKFVFWSIQLKPVYEKQMNEIISAFEKKHPDYRVIWVDIPIQEAQKRTLASILSSTPADLVNLNPDFSVVLAQKNALEYFSEDDTKQFHKSLVDKLKYKGKIYALPFYATSPVTVYNRKIFKKCAIKDNIKTYDDLYNISNKLYSCSNKAVLALNLNENDTLAKILNKYDITNSIDTKNTIRVYSMFDDMYKKGYLPKDVLTINHREVVEKYMSDKVSLIIAGSNFINMIKQNAPDIYSKTALMNQLTSKNGKYDAAIMNLIIPKKSKNKKLAYEFALELTNEKNQLKLAKLTNVLPANKYALENEYFKNCSSDPVDLSRCIAKEQLDNLSIKDFGQKNKKAINDEINKALEEILLNKNSCPETIKTRINNLFLQLNILSSG